MGEWQRDTRLGDKKTSWVFSQSGLHDEYCTLPFDLEAAIEARGMVLALTLLRKHGCITIPESELSWFNDFEISVQSGQWQRGGRDEKDLG